MTEAATTHEPFRAGPGEGRSFWFLGTLMTLKATGEQTGGAFGLIEQVLPPGFAPPPHVHHAEDEAFYILEGELTFRCGDRTLPAPRGTLVFLPRGVAHTFQVSDAGPARLLQLNTPAGLEQFFVELGEPVADPATPPAGLPDVARLLALAPGYRIEIMGPPPGH